MNVETIKKDEVGIPVQAKSRIIALGHYEDTFEKKVIVSSLPWL
jgi:hypothetical protein